MTLPMSLRLADATVLLALVLSSATPRHGARAQTPAPGDGGPSSAASFVAPTEVMIDRAGNLYVTERAGYRVRRIDARTGVITTYAGSERGYSGDGAPTGRGSSRTS